MSQFVVGLTGGIASGKSTVSRLFASHGIVVADADLIARQVVSPGQPALAAIADTFGAHLILADGQLDRAALRTLVFADPAARRQLEAITHPAIRQQVLATCMAAESPYALADIPLLAEAGRNAYPWMQRVVVVDVPVQVQIERLCQRDGIDATQARAILAAQASREQRLAIADDVIDNSGAPEALQAQVATLHQQYLALAGH